MRRFRNAAVGCVLHSYQTTYITGLIVIEANTYFNLFVRVWSVAPVSEANSKSDSASSRAWRETKRIVRRRIGPVGPFARNTEAAALQLAEDQRVDTRYASFLEYFEASAAQRMERMPDFSPSQRRTALKCSSL